MLITKGSDLRSYGSCAFGSCKAAHSRLVDPVVVVVRGHSPLDPARLGNSALFPTTKFVSAYTPLNRDGFLGTPSRRCASDTKCGGIPTRFRLYRGGKIRNQGPVGSRVSDPFGPKHLAHWLCQQKKISACMERISACPRSIFLLVQ